MTEQRKPIMIYVAGEQGKISLREAMKTITESWVVDGNSSLQTTIDLADACRALLAEHDELCKLAADLSNANTYLDGMDGLDAYEIVENFEDRIKAIIGTVNEKVSQATIDSATSEHAVVAERES